jgi:hypothetical protein
MRAPRLETRSAALLLSSAKADKIAGKAAFSLSIIVLW